MNINFESLEKIPYLIEVMEDIKKSLDTKVDKRWLSVKELSKYIDYSTDRIHKLKGIEFLEGVHFHKRGGKLLFDKEMIDKWVLGLDIESMNHINIIDYTNDIVNNLAAS
jgi:hypothetical protein